MCQVSVYSRKVEIFGFGIQDPSFKIWFLPISKSSDIIAYWASSCSRPSRIALPNFGGIVSFPCNVPTCLPPPSYCLSSECLNRPQHLWTVFWWKLPKFLRHLLRLSWNPASLVDFYCRCCSLLTHRSPPPEGADNPVSSWYEGMSVTGLPIQQILENYNSQNSHTRTDSAPLP